MRPELSVRTDETWMGHYSAACPGIFFFLFSLLWTRQWYSNSTQQRTMMRKPTPPCLLPPAARLSTSVLLVRLSKHKDIKRTHLAPQKISARLHLEIPASTQQLPELPGIVCSTIRPGELLQRQGVATCLDRLTARRDDVLLVRGIQGHRPPLQICCRGGQRVKDAGAQGNLPSVSDSTLALVELLPTLRTSTTI